jgi:vacuolar-type H+-ATPase subunit F/Vma7
MIDQKIYVIGNEEIVHILGLLGIEGTIIENDDDFIQVFESITSIATIGMIIIAFEISHENEQILADFKFNNKTPFIFHLPDIFSEGLEESSRFKSIFKTIKKIVS